MRLREIRQKKGIGQRELAKQIGTDEPMMSRLENYKCLPIPPMMKKLLEALGCERVEEIYEPHEIYLQLANLKATVTKKKKKSEIYKLTATLPKEAKELFDKALRPLGYLAYHSSCSFNKIILNLFIKSFERISILTNFSYTFKFLS